jgi:arginine decarboxylase
MSTTSTNDRILGLNEFFAASEVWVDPWRTLNRVAKALAGTPGRPAGGQDPKVLLTELAPLEELCGYPGPRLLAQVRERLQTGDRTGFSHLVPRISGPPLRNSYRDDQEAWKAEEESEAHRRDQPRERSKAKA